MGEPAVRCCAVPMLDTGRNVYHIARQHLHSGLAPFLIKAASGNADQELPAAGFCVMDMPVVAASRLKGHIENPHLLLGDRRKIAFPAEILRKTIICRADWKDHGCSVFCHGAVVRFLAPHFFCHAERRPCFRPSCIKGGMGQDLSNFFLGNAIFLCTFQMIFERRICKPLCHECRHRHKGTVTQRKLVLTAPYLSEQHIVVQFRKLWREIAQSISSGCLFDCHFCFTSIYLSIRSCAVFYLLL